MIHRFLILLVVAWQIASQLAVVPHAHAEMTSDEHQELGDAPHLHFPTWGGGRAHHDHPHEAPNSHCPNSHCPNRDCPNRDCPNQSDSHQHNCGVIFVAANDGVVASRVDVERSGLTVWIVPLVLTGVIVRPVSSANSVRTGHSLDGGGDGSDVYLTLRKLLI